MELIDSDDQDFGPPSPSRFNDLGKRSKELMIASALSDRLDSARTVKRLKFTSKNPKQESKTQLWHDRLTAFRSETLRIAESVHASPTKRPPLLTRRSADSTMPTARDIERFISCIYKYMKPNGGGLVTVGTMQQGIEYTMKATTFHFADFKSSRRDRVRIDSLLQTMVLKDQLTNDSKREKQWIGAYTVARLVDITYRDSLDNGTKNWDKTLAKVQTIILHAALGCRTGDVTESGIERHKLPYLTYSDITMKLVDGSDLEHLSMMVRLRNNKGKK